MRFKLVEPLRELFKDEVRLVGQTRPASTKEFVWAETVSGSGWPYTSFFNDHSPPAPSFLS